MSYDEAREIVYGMPYDEWKARRTRRGSACGQGEFRAVARLRRRRLARKSIKKNLIIRDTHPSLG